ncbi:effector-associated constant component EACC1 [Streptomyces sp. NBC_01294]|uniref:effector-associated constant component EACC1 n=1 Tax=Streptomyces sp. NBC_01294 TaxID=2903815 RepID=UPI002DD92CC9|nr:hypothetical protein [Streptomyces sp. NBC_01294]WRZ60349.1 hypothetical protein OG534_30035 [Streptomyces sp. NBC_01294]
MREYDLRVDPYSAGQGPETELRSLLLWLREDETLRREARGRIRSSAAIAAAGGTAMGSPGFDLLQLTVGSGLATGSLVFSVLQWQASRHGRAPALTVRRGPYEVTLTGGEAGDPEALQRIVAVLENAGGDAGGDGEARRDGDGSGDGGARGDGDGADDGTA